MKALFYKVTQYLKQKTSALNIILLLIILLIIGYIWISGPTDDEKMIIEYKNQISVVKNENSSSQNLIDDFSEKIRIEEESIDKNNRKISCYGNQVTRIMNGQAVEKGYCENVGYIKRVNSEGKAQHVPILSGTTPLERMNSLLISYGRNEDVEENRWERVGIKNNIIPSVLVCIAKADSSLGRELKSTNNFGNVGNNDRGDVVHFETALQGISAIGEVLNNKYLGHKQSIGSLSVGGGGDAPLYATSPENWNNNVLNCLSEIHIGEKVDEDFKIRIQ